MTGAISKFHLDWIIRVCGQADLAVDIVGRGLIVLTVNRKDGTSVIKSNTFRYTRWHRADRAARKTLHVAHSFWLAHLGLCWERWA